MLNERVVLSLFDLSGTWSKPWHSAGYVVYQVDLQHKAGIIEVEKRLFLCGLDMLDMNDVLRITDAVPCPQILLATPPCDCFTRASSWLWAKMDAEGRTSRDLSLIKATLSLVRGLRPKVWALENPPGRLWIQKGGGLLQDVLGPPVLRFNPWQFAGWVEDSDAERYTKLTYLWGKFNPPPVHLKPLLPLPTKSKLDHISSLGSRSKALRAITPKGFAEAFFRCNSGSSM